MRPPRHMKTVTSLPNPPVTAENTLLPKSFAAGYWKDHNLCASSHPRAQQLQQHDFSLLLPSCLSALTQRDLFAIPSLPQSLE